MRILILTPEFDGAGGGIITVYRALAPALRESVSNRALSKAARAQILFRVGPSMEAAPSAPSFEFRLVSGD